MSAVNMVSSFRKRVTIQGAVQVSDSQGGYTETWADGSTVWASIEPMKGYEKFQAMQMQTPLSHKIMMRYTSEITTASRIKYGTRIFWVKEVISIDERQQFIQVRAIERS